MAKVARRTVTKTETVDDPSGRPAGAPEGRRGATEDQELEEAVAEFGGTGARAHLSRLDETRGAIVRLCTLDAAQATQEFIQSNFGGGRYTIRFRNSLNQIAKTRTLEIDRRIPPKIPAWLLGSEQTPSAEVVLTPAPSRGTKDTDPEMRDLLRIQIVEMMKDSNEMRTQTANAQLTMLQTVTATIKSMTDSTAALVASVTKDRQAPAPANQMTFGDILKMQTDAKNETLALVKELRGGNADAPTIEKTLTLMDRLRDAAERFPKAIAEDAEEGGGFNDLIGKLAGALVPLLAGLLQPKAGAAPEPIAPPAVRPGLPVPALPPPPSDTPPVPLWLTLAKSSLLEAAEEARHPADVAASLMTLAPRRFHGQIRKTVMEEHAVADLIAFAPEFAPYAGWLGEIVTVLRAEFEPGDASDPPSPPE